MTALIFTMEEKRPFDCIACNSCTQHCPQVFMIPEYLEELCGMLETI